MGVPGWVSQKVIGVVKSSLSVHAWSLVATVTSVVIAAIVVFVVLLLPLRLLFLGALSQSSQYVVC